MKKGVGAKKWWKQERWRKVSSSQVKEGRECGDGTAEGDICFICFWRKSWIGRETERRAPRDGNLKKQGSNQENSRKTIRVIRLTSQLKQKRYAFQIVPHEPSLDDSLVEEAAKGWSQVREAVTGKLISRLQLYNVKAEWSMDCCEQASNKYYLLSQNQNIAHTLYRKKGFQLNKINREFNSRIRSKKRST